MRMRLGVLGLLFFALPAGVVLGLVLLAGKAVVLLLGKEGVPLFGKGTLVVILLISTRLISSLGSGRAGRLAPMKSLTWLAELSSTPVWVRSWGGANEHDLIWFS